MLLLPLRSLVSVGYAVHAAFVFLSAAASSPSHEHANVLKLAKVTLEQRLSSDAAIFELLKVTCDV